MYRSLDADGGKYGWVNERISWAGKQKRLSEKSLLVLITYLNPDSALGR